MNDEDRTTTGRGVLVVLAIVAALLIVWGAIDGFDSLFNYMSIGD